MNARRTCAALVAAIAACALSTACAGDPDLSSTRAELRLGLRVAGPDWQGAPAGCEGVEGGGLVLAACDGEPTLGALVDARGRVRCVDSLSLLVIERWGVTPLAGDPSPQPNRPPPPGALPLGGAR